MFTYENGIKLGKKNFSLLTAIKENLNLSRKDLVDLIVNHPSFIYKELKHKRSLAWKLVLNAKKSTCEKSYKIDKDNRLMWVCGYELDFIPYK